MEVLQVDGILLRLDAHGSRTGSSSSEESGKLSVITKTPSGREVSYPLCPTRAAFEQCLRDRQYEEVRTVGPV